MDFFKLVDKLETDRILSKDEFVALIENRETVRNYITDKAVKIRQKHYSNKVYVRGLIEFSNYCKNDCYYCGIRRSNKNASRYRLTKEDILECCKEGYSLGFRTFVLQGGEDNHFDDDTLCDIIKSIRTLYPDCAITISAGEKSRESYQRIFDAGANRYLLRHETANDEHYAKLHPESLTLKNRKRCLFDLKEIGFQTGSGFMVGSPFQTTENLAEDLIFLAQLKPQMVGIGPFIPHCDTPFSDKKAGDAELVVFLLSVIRLMLPTALIPATTALGTIATDGRERGIMAGANVIMPNLSPLNVRKKYLLYNDKISTGDEAAESLNNLRLSMQKIGYEVVVDRGDFKE